MTQTVGAAVATVDQSPRALVRQYEGEFSAVLPSHVKSEAWVRRAAGALRRGEKDNRGQFKLEVAAQNNPQAFISALRDAAGLGLTPGTDEFYLTPRSVKGQMEILGIVGYQGYIELMYRAGAVASVIVEVVRTRDKFSYVPGRDERPVHEIDWDAEDRGDLRLVYAYAQMKDGATSKVVVLNRAQIAKVRSKAQGANSEYSPWNTNEEAMWLKSAVRQLRKWVPTSSEYITAQVRAVREGVLGAPDVPVPQHVAVHIPEDDAVEAEIVEES